MEAATLWPCCSHYASHARTLQLLFTTWLALSTHPLFSGKSLALRLFVMLDLLARFVSDCLNGLFCRKSNVFRDGASQTTPGDQVDGQNGTGIVAAHPVIPAQDSSYATRGCFDALFFRAPRPTSNEKTSHSTSIRGSSVAVADGGGHTIAQHDTMSQVKARRGNLEVDSTEQDIQSNVTAYETSHNLATRQDMVSQPSHTATALEMHVQSIPNCPETAVQQVATNVAELDQPESSIQLDQDHCPPPEVAQKNVIPSEVNNQNPPAGQENFVPWAPDTLIPTGDDLNHSGTPPDPQDSIDAEETINARPDDREKLPRKNLKKKMEGEGVSPSESSASEGRLPRKKREERGEGENDWPSASLSTEERLPRKNLKDRIVD